MKYALSLVVGALVLVSSCSLFPLSNKVEAQTRLTAVTAAASRSAVAAPRTLDGGAFAVTPSNASGMVITASVMVGDFNGYALFLITPDVTGFDESSVRSDSDVLEAFDLSDPLTVSREMTLGGSNYPPDDEAVASRIELLFGWIDLEFSLVSGAMEGIHTVRVAYADVDDLGYKRGDVLYLGSGEYKWLDTATGEFTDSRPLSPASISELAAYDGAIDGMGNQHIPTFSADIPIDRRPTLRRQEMLASGPWSFTVYFDLTDGIGFSSDPAGFTSAADLIAAFDIAADVGGDLGFGAELEVMGPQ